MRMFHLVLLLLAATVAITPASAAMLTFTDKATWQSSLVSSVDFSLTDPDNLALADELAVAPAVNDTFGAGLTFGSANTLLPEDFTFAVDPTEEVPGTNHEIIFSCQWTGNLYTFRRRA